MPFLLSTMYAGRIRYKPFSFQFLIKTITVLASFSAPSRTQMYCLHPQALKVRNPLWAQAHAELSGVDRGCKADESATTTHRRLILAALCSCLSEIGIRNAL